VGDRGGARDFLETNEGPRMLNTEFDLQGLINFMLRRDGQLWTNSSQAKNPLKSQDYKVDERGWLGDFLE
jgi:hypothetical protein